MSKSARRARYGLLKIQAIFLKEEDVKSVEDWWCFRTRIPTCAGTQIKTYPRVLGLREVRHWVKTPMQNINAVCTD